MLLSLSVRDVVLIDKLDIDFQQGLGALTGETGAGKSILLDSVGLAIGNRADSGLVRSGQKQASVTATFALPKGHPAYAILEEQAIEVEDGHLILKRVVKADGGSRVLVNGESASVALMRQLGETLVEVHGQHQTQGLFDIAGHKQLLDTFAGLGADRVALRQAYQAWREADKALKEAQDRIRNARADEEYLRHMLEELELLATAVGEEEELAQERTLLMQGEKIGTALNDALSALQEDGGVQARMRAAQRALDRIADGAGERFSNLIDALERAAVEAAEAENQIDETARDLDLDPQRLELVEERLFALRAAARKHGCSVDDLVKVQEETAAKIAALEHGEEDLVRLQAQAGQCREDYRAKALALSAARQKAAVELDHEISAELPPLKLEKARFVTAVHAAEDEKAWGPDGLDTVEFKVATNPGQTPGSLGKIASGGELARIMLAIKVILARTGTVQTMIFDEVDAGIGGATADAVGERLYRLAQGNQVLVVTHSPQVAARADHHYRIQKTVSGDMAVTDVHRLDSQMRREEIARMLAGQDITDAARAAADSLLAQKEKAS